MQHLGMLLIFALFIEDQQEATPLLVNKKGLCLQQSPNCCTISHLTLDQRYQISTLRHLPPAQIARQIGKHRSVVTRELARNATSRADCKPHLAQKAYHNRRAKNATSPPS